MSVSNHPLLRLELGQVRQYEQSYIKEPLSLINELYKHQCKFRCNSSFSTENIMHCIEATNEKNRKLFSAFINCPMTGETFGCSESMIRGASSDVSSSKIVMLPGGSIMESKYTFFTNKKTAKHAVCSVLWDILHRRFGTHAPPLYNHFITGKELTTLPLEEPDIKLLQDFIKRCRTDVKNSYKEHDKNCGLCITQGNLQREWDLCMLTISNRQIESPRFIDTHVPALNGKGKIDAYKGHIRHDKSASVNKLRNIINNTKLSVVDIVNFKVQVINGNIEQFASLVNTLHECNIICFDCEMNFDNLRKTSTISIWGDKLDEVFLLDTRMMWQHIPLLCGVFYNPNIIKVAFSVGGMDIKSLFQDFGIIVVSLFDMQLLHQYHNGKNPVGLIDMTKSITDQMCHQCSGLHHDISSLLERHSELKVRYQSSNQIDSNMLRDCDDVKLYCSNDVKLLVITFNALSSLNVTDKVLDETLKISRQKSANGIPYGRKDLEHTKKIILPSLLCKMIYESMWNDCSMLRYLELLELRRQVALRYGLIESNVCSYNTLVGLSVENSMYEMAHRDLEKLIKC